MTEVRFVPNQFRWVLHTDNLAVIPVYVDKIDEDFLSDFVKKLAEYGCDERRGVLLSFNSLGYANWGVVQEFRDLILSVESPVYGVVEDSCEAAALYLFEHCKRRFAALDARLRFAGFSFAVCEVPICECEFVCVHTPPEDQMRDLRSVESLEDLVARHISRHTAGRLPVAVVRRFMREERVLGAKEALALGLVDSVLPR